MFQISRMLTGAAFAVAVLGAAGLMMPPSALAVGDGELGLPAHKPYKSYKGKKSWGKGLAVVHAGGHGKHAVPTLAGALRKVRYGGTVVVHPGVNGYDTLKIRKAVTIVTANDVSVPIYPNGARACVDIDVRLNERVEIFNLEFRAPPGGHRTAECIVSRSANLRLTNVVVEGGNLAPAVIVHGGYSLISKSRIYGGASGLVLGAQPAGDHVLYDSLVHGAAGHGLVLDRGVSILATGNVIERAQLAGILDNARSGLFSRNDIKRNGAGVVRAETAGHGHLAGGKRRAAEATVYSDNLLIGNGGPGIDATGGPVRTSGNCIAFNLGPGVTGTGPGSPPNHLFRNADYGWDRGRDHDRDYRGGRGHSRHDSGRRGRDFWSDDDDAYWADEDDAMRAFREACGPRIRHAKKVGYDHEHKHTHSPHAPYRSHTHEHAH